MIPTLATVTINGPILEKLTAIAAAGFLAVEIFDTDLANFNGSPADIKKAASDLGLHIANYFPLRNVEGMPTAHRSRARDQAERYLDIAVELGAEMVMACSNTAPESLPDKARIAADLNELGDLAISRGLKIAYEGLAWGTHVSDYRTAWQLTSQAAHPAVGLVLDTFHICARELSLLEIKTIPRDAIFLVQISDAPRLKLDYLTWSRHHRGLPGQGEFPLGEFTQLVQATGYEGIVSLECFSDTLKTLSSNQVAKDSYQSLVALWE